MRTIKSNPMFNPPTAAEIKAARAIMQECMYVDLDKDPVPPVMVKAWEGNGGWHRDEIYFGILIGLRIAQTRQERRRTSRRREGGKG